MGFVGIFLLEYLEGRQAESSPEIKPRLFQSERAMGSFKSQSNFERRKTLDNITQFFAVVLPLEFRPRPWYSKFWIRMLEKHPYIAYLAAAEGRENYTAKKWMCMTFELLNVLFIDSIFAPIAAPDAEVCEKLTSASACLKPSSIDLIDPLCSWNREEKSCEFREIEQNLGVIIIAVLIIKLVEFPLMTLCEYLVDQVGNNNIVKLGIDEEPVSARKQEHVIVPNKAELSEIRDLERSHIMPYSKVVPLVVGIPGPSNTESEAVFRLAARLRYLQSKIDEVAVEEEVDFLISHADLFVKSDVIEELRTSLPVKSNVADARNRSKLASKVHRAREMSRTVLKELEEKTSRNEKQIYLVKRFIVELLIGVDRWVAERFFFDEVESEISVPYRVFCAVLLMLIICGELTYVFLTGVMMGANATRVWLICLAVVVMQGKRQMSSA